MKNFCVLLLAAGNAVASIGEADRADAHEVHQKVSHAVELLKEQPAAALDRLRDPDGEFVWKDSYVFVVDCDADKVISNPVFPERVGGDIKQHTDYAGRVYGVELCAAAKAPAGAWIDYFWLPPGADKPVRKLSYIRSVPGTSYQVGAGVYDYAISVPPRSIEFGDAH